MTATGFIDGYALVVYAEQGYEQTVVLIDRNGLEQYDKVTIDRSDRLEDFRGGYALFQHIAEKDDAYGSKMEYYFICPDGTRHTVGKDDVSAAAAVGFNRVACGLFYDGDARPMIRKIDNSDAIAVIRETESTKVYDKNAPADMTYNGEGVEINSFAKQTITYEGVDGAPFVDYSGRLGNLTSNMLYDENDVRVYLSEAGGDFDDFNLIVENNTDYLRVNLNVLSIGVNHLIDKTDTLNVVEGLEAGEAVMVGLSARSMYDSYFNLYDDYMSYMGDEIARIPIECLTFDMEIQIGSNNPVEHRKATLYTDAYREEDMTALLGQRIGEYEQEIYVADLGCVTVPMAVYQLNTRAGLGVLVHYEGEYEPEEIDIPSRWFVNGQYRISDRDIKSFRTESGEIQLFLCSSDDIRRKFEISGGVPLSIGYKIVKTGQMSYNDDPADSILHLFTLKMNGFSIPPRRTSRLSTTTPSTRPSPAGCGSRTRPHGRRRS